MTARRSDASGRRAASAPGAPAEPSAGHIPGHTPGRAAARPRAALSDATVARLPLYLSALDDLVARGRATVSSEELASASGVGSAMLRKDLSHLGSYGTRGVGYDVERLAAQIARELGATRDRSVVIVGVGNLGQALANYDGFASRGFRVCALLDADPVRTGQVVAGLVVRHVDELEQTVAACGPCIGVIATPAEAAQEVCDRLVAAGARSILTFAPVVLAVPDEVDVRRVDLSMELQILAFHEQRRGDTGPGAVPDAPPGLPAVAGVRR